MTAKLNSKTSLGEKAYNQILERIITLKLKPSEQIDERALEKTLSIGRTPIREALQRLASEKLLDSTQGRGFFVRPISIDDVKELVEALTFLERTAVHFAAERISEEQLRQLSSLHASHQKAIAGKDFLKATIVNSDMHSTIYRAMNNGFLLAALENLRHQADRLGYLTYTQKHSSNGVSAYDDKAIQDHEDLIQCFRNGDSERAVEIMTSHCKRFFLRVCHYMEPRVYPLEGCIDPEIFMKSP